MVAYNFQARFADAVASGRKRQTIQTMVRLLERGDFLSYTSWGSA